MNIDKLKSRAGKNGKQPQDESLGGEILDQTSFTRMLCAERKRIERSGRRFVLMLLECEKLVRTIPGLRAHEKVLQTLLKTTRETDIKGWYEEPSTIGVIFTEIGPGDGRVVADALLGRVTKALSSALSIDEIHKIHISFYVFPDELSETGTNGPPDLTLYPDEISSTTNRRVSLLIKRSVDIVGSVTALLALSPVLLAIAVAIKCTSPGPVLFRQQRMGRFGRRFVFLKFRSMHVSNDETIHREFISRFISRDAKGEGSEIADGVFKIRNDPRVTPIGRFLRRTSLDELPQFFNVLSGEMSIVGPRPPIPYEYARYDTWHRRRLLAVKPGITGLWQVCGRSRVKFDDMVRLDLLYSKTWSLRLDLEILLRTPAAVFLGNGAY